MKKYTFILCLFFFVSTRLFAQSTVIVESITLHYFPSTDPKGNSWDYMGGKPDVFFYLSDANGKVQYKSNVVENANPQSSATFREVNHKTSSGDLFVTFYDKDAIQDTYICEVGINLNEAIKKKKKEVKIIKNGYAVTINMLFVNY